MRARNENDEWRCHDSAGCTAPHGWALKLVPVNIVEAMSNEICPTVFPLIDDSAQHQPRFDDLDRRMPLATHRFRVLILMPPIVMLSPYKLSTRPEAH